MSIFRFDCFLCAESHYTGKSFSGITPHILKNLCRKTFFLSVLFAFSFCSDGFQTANRSIPWKDYSESVFEEAKVNKYPVLINFYSSDCTPCVKMKKELFASEKFYELIEKYHVICILLDTDRYPEVMKKFEKEYGVSGMPTVLFLDYEKNEIGRSEGYRSAAVSFRRFEEMMAEWEKYPREL